MNDDNSDPSNKTDSESMTSSTQKKKSKQTENPYFDYEDNEEIDCDYELPVPSPRNVYMNVLMPPPHEKVKIKFEYVTRNGNKITLDHPLPPDLPVDTAFVMPNVNLEQSPQQLIGDSDMVCCRSDDFEAEQVIFYACVAIFPLSGLLIYYCIHQNNPKLADNILTAMLASFVIYGVILFAILYS